MSLLAIDIGSSRCKAVVFTLSGEILARSAQQYVPEFPQPSFAEMDPDTFLDAVRTVSRSVAALALRDPIEAVCLSSHGETLVPVNSAGMPVRSAILNIDNRASEETVWCEQQLGRKHLFEVTGHVSQTMYPVPKLLWLRKHQPELFSNGIRFLGVISYIFSRLGLRAYIDYSLASRFMAWDVRRKRWSDEILALIDIKEDALPIPVPAGTIAGKLSAEAAGQLGLRAGTVMIVGGHDQACASLGAGVITSGRVSDSMGTYECIAATSDQPQLSEEALSCSLNSYCHVIPDKFITIAYFPAGIMVQWFYHLLHPSGPDERLDGLPEKSEDERYARLESLAPKQPSGLFVVPYLIGTGNPDFDPDARGAILGLTPDSHRGYIYKGILEGVANELSKMTGIFERTMGQFTDTHASGGGTRSPLGIRLRAAMTGHKFHLMSCPESVCLGGAILAGVAVGLYPSIVEAVTKMVREREVVEPDHNLTRIYGPIQKQYSQLNSRLSVFRKSGQAVPQIGEEA